MFLADRIFQASWGTYHSFFADLDCLNIFCLLMSMILRSATIHAICCRTPCSSCHCSSLRFWLYVF